MGTDDSECREFGRQTKRSGSGAPVLSSSARIYIYIYITFSMPNVFSSAGSNCFRVSATCRRPDAKFGTIPPTTLSYIQRKANLFPVRLHIPVTQRKENREEDPGRTEPTSRRPSPGGTARFHTAALMAADLMDVGEWMQLKRYDARVVPRSSGGPPVQIFMWLSRWEAQPKERPEK